MGVLFDDVFLSFAFLLPLIGGIMRIPLASTLTERPRFFHVQDPATRVAVGTFVMVFEQTSSMLLRSSKAVLRPPM